MVEEEWLDVNRMDTDGLLANHWGPPIAHAEKGKGGEDAVWSVLARGTDPRAKSCWGYYDALSLAKSFGNGDVALILKLGCWPRARYGRECFCSGHLNRIMSFFSPCSLTKAHKLTFSHSDAYT